MSYIGNTSTTQAFTPAIDYFSGDGSTVAFTLSRPVASVAQVQVVVNNVAQNPSTAFTVSGNTITFTGAPSSGTNNIYIQYTSPITQVIAPGQGTVNTTSLSGGTVSTSADITANGLTVGKGSGSVATNTAVGYSALAANTTGSINTAVGYGALQTNNTGSNNTAVGLQALRYNTTGGYNSAFSYSALYSNTTGSYNTAAGYNALAANTTGTNNTAIGNSALNANTTASDNQAFGTTALYSNTTGTANTAVGRDSLRNNTTASNNTAVGYQAGYTNSTGTSLTALGYQAGYSLTTGNYNTLIGVQTGYSLTTGSGNTFIGTSVNTYCGGLVTTGSKNTIIGGYNGNQGGLDIRTSNNYIVLSDGDGNPRGFYDDSGRFISALSAPMNTDIGAHFGSPSNGQAVIQTWNKATSGSAYHMVFRYGAGPSPSANGSITSNGSSTTYSTSSDYRLKENVTPMVGALDKVSQLKPCTYTWKFDGSDGQGFIAHELQEVFPDAVIGEKDAVNEDGTVNPQGIDTSFLVATLTAAIQELNAKVEAQAAEIAALKGQ